MKIPNLLDISSQHQGTVKHTFNCKRRTSDKRNTSIFLLFFSCMNYILTIYNNTFNGTDRDNNLRVCVIYIYTMSWALGMSTFYVTRNHFDNVM